MRYSESCGDFSSKFTCISPGRVTETLRLLKFNKNLYLPVLSPSCSMVAHAGWDPKQSTGPSAEDISFSRGFLSLLKKPSVIYMSYFQKPFFFCSVVNFLA